MVRPYPTHWHLLIHIANLSDSLVLSLAKTHQSERMRRESSVDEWSQTMVPSLMLFYANMFGLDSLGAYNGVRTGQDALYMRQECYSRALSLGFDKR